MSALPIPYKLHQTWKSKAALEQRFSNWRESFFQCNPGIENKFYDDNDNGNLVRQLAPSLSGLYNSFPKEIFRADFVRSLYMFFDGGLYADLDFQCLRSFEPIFSSNRIFLGSMGTDSSMPQNIPNAMMASPIHEGFWLGYLRNIELAWNEMGRDPNIDCNPEHVTGPIVLKRTVVDYSNLDIFKSNVKNFIDEKGLDVKQISFAELEVLPGHLWYPLNWHDQIHQMFRQHVLENQTAFSLEQARALFPNSMAVTYWSHTW